MPQSEIITRLYDQLNVNPKGLFSIEGEPYNDESDWFFLNNIVCMAQFSISST